MNIYESSASGGEKMSVFTTAMDSGGEISITADQMLTVKVGSSDKNQDEARWTKKSPANS